MKRNVTISVQIGDRHHIASFELDDSDSPDKWAEEVRRHAIGVQTIIMESMRARVARGDKEPE